MLQRLLLTSLLSLFLGISQAQNTVNGSFVHDGITRTYSCYIPASYIPGQAVPLIVNLHGYTSSGSLQAIYGDFRPIADTAGFIVVHPDGTPDPVTGQKFWNFGILGMTVNDVGFLENLVDTISAHYSINQNRVYCTGMSNGSFMCYAMACQSNRFAAIGGVTGSMSIPMYNTCTPAHPTPVIHIHGTDDTTNPYAGNSSSKGIHDVVLFWVNNNNCDTVPLITNVPDTDPTDNTTAEHYLYSGGIIGHTVEHFKVIGGGHTWPGSSINLTSNGNTCHDFSASIEIWRFFSQYERQDALSVHSNKPVELTINPNPTNGKLTIHSDAPVHSVTILDMQGRTLVTFTGTNLEQLDLEQLSAGNYLLQITGAGYTHTKKLVIN